MPTPDKPCFAIFKGRRMIRDAICEMVHEPVEIVEYRQRGNVELAVCMTGRAQKFPLRNFVGEWTILELT